MQTLGITLGERAYAIHVGSGILEHADLVVDALDTPRVAIVTNRVVGPLYADGLFERLKQRGVNVTVAMLEDGESYKTWESLNVIYDTMLRARCDRRTTVIAVGGGVVGDVAGFAAATFMRGVPFIQVPTTLLAQVDSSVGGKTAINHPSGKNMIGAFYQPAMVLADIGTLKTLPDRELKAGLAEVIKHGAVRDASFFEWLEANMDRLLARDPSALTHAVVRSIEIKAAVVSIDERETGPRALLNFGHTFGHAIEAGLGFGAWLHGEAVAAGMVMAADLSVRVGKLGAGEAMRIRRLIQRAGLPEVGPNLGADQYLDLMSVDKKVALGRLRFILLAGLGNGFIAESTPENLVRSTLAASVA
jgi:shikimate kinase / 3-dehydroquinate synthase